MPNRENIFTQFELNGKRVGYDACRLASDSTLEKAKKDYENFDYLGEGTQIWVNGIKQGWRKELYYFFRSRSLKDHFPILENQGCHLF